MSNPLSAPTSQVMVNLHTLMLFLYTATSFSYCYSVVNIYIQLLLNSFIWQVLWQSIELMV